jgi:hypothetical protein
LEPSTGIGDGGCVMGIPTIPNLGDPKPQTPCEKTKETYENTAVKSRYEILKGKTSEPSESGYGFKTVLDGNGGTTTQTNLLNPDITDPSKMIVSIFPTSYGYIHTHLDKTDDKISVKIFSPADINTFIAFLHNAKANSTQLGNIFGGMIASDPDTGHNIYQIHYTGDGSDLPAIFTKEQVKVLKAEYTRMAQRTANDNEGVLYHSDLQKLFYKFLKKMNLNNVALTKIEDNPKKFKKVNFDANGNPTEENCP